MLQKVKFENEFSTFNLSLFNFNLEESSWQMLDAAHGEAVRTIITIYWSHLSGQEAEKTCTAIARSSRR